MFCVVIVVLMVVINNDFGVFKGFNDCFFFDKIVVWWYKLVIKI